MKNIQRLYDSPCLTNDVYKYKSTEYHRKNLIDIKRRKVNKLYAINDDYLNIKRHSQSPSSKYNGKIK